MDSNNFLTRYNKTYPPLKQSGNISSMMFYKPSDVKLPSVKISKNFRSSQKAPGIGKIYEIVDSNDLTLDFDGNPKSKSLFKIKQTSAFSESPINKVDVSRKTNIKLHDQVGGPPFPQSGQHDNSFITKNQEDREWNSSIKDSHSSVKKLILGYSGWYPGKIEHKVGKSEFPQVVELINDSTRTFPQVISHFPSAPFSPNDHQQLSKIFHNPRSDSVTDETIFGSSPSERIRLVLNDIRFRVHGRYPTIVMKRLHVKQLFQYYDRNRHGVISSEQFKAGLLRLNLILTNSDINKLIDMFAGEGKDTVRYLQFVQEICGSGVINNTF